MDIRKQTCLSAYGMCENKMERNVSVNDLFWILDMPYESHNNHFYL